MFMVKDLFHLCIVERKKLKELMHENDTPSKKRIENDILTKKNKIGNAIFLGIGNAIMLSSVFTKPGNEQPLKKKMTHIEYLYISTISLYNYFFYKISLYNYYYY